GKGRFQWPEARAVDIERPELRPRCFFGVSNAADRRLREDRSRHHRVVYGNLALTVDSVGERMAFADRDGRQVQAVRHIADCVDVWDAALRVSVNENRSDFVELNTGGLKTKASRVRHTTNGRHHTIEL